jgi:hypothetical protein
MGAPTIELDWLVLSPKPPSSGMTTDWAAFNACLAAAADGLRTVLKVAVFDDADYDCAGRAACPWQSRRDSRQSQSAPLHSPAVVVPA